MDIIQPGLFADLPFMKRPPRMLNGFEVKPFTAIRKSKTVREAEKKAIAEMQFDLFMQMLIKPIITSIGKRAVKIKKRVLDTWEEAKVFAGSNTIHQPQKIDHSVPLLMDWSNEELLKAHQWVLEESIEALRSEDNKQEKMDVLEWIFSPAYIDKIGKSLDGRPCIIRRHASDIPFSFENCCRSIGLTDPDVFREELVEKMNEELKPLLRKYLVSYTG